jgi:coenzyme F420-reducing hydrogenase beta subunit
MIKKEKTGCSGCTACAALCPKNAITMQSDAMGFLYPEIDSGACTGCGLCEKLCPFHKDYKTEGNFKTPLVYAARSRDIRELEKSQSGALFAVLSDWILEKGGVVYGAGYTDHFRVAHKRATSKEGRDELRGSKYVQSDINNTFKQARDDLQGGTGRPVLFSGTPCQIAGLKASLTGIDTSDLYLCDLVCHGVPSPFVWRDYVNYIEKKYKKTIVKVNFRDKRFGWKAHKESFTFSDTYTYTYTYTYLFYAHVMFRPACEKCPFASYRRTGDITLGDFWEKSKSDRIYAAFSADNRGISLALLNTPKGQKLFDAVKHHLHYVESDTAECWQPQLEHPPRFSSKFSGFEKDYLAHDFGFIIRKYGNTGIHAIARAITEKAAKTARVVLGDNGYGLLKTLLKR